MTFDFVGELEGSGLDEYEYEGSGGGGGSVWSLVVR